VRGRPRSRAPDGNQWLPLQGFDRIRPGSADFLYALRCCQGRTRASAADPATSWLHDLHDIPPARRTVPGPVRLLHLGRDAWCPRLFLPTLPGCDQTLHASDLDAVRHRACSSATSPLCQGTKPRSRIRQPWQHLATPLVGLPEVLRPFDALRAGRSPLRFPGRNVPWQRRFAVQVTALAVHGACRVRALFAPRLSHLPGIFQPGGILGVFSASQPILANRSQSRRLRLVGGSCPSFPWRHADLASGRAGWRSFDLGRRTARRASRAPDRSQQAFARCGRSHARCHAVAWLRRRSTLRSKRSPPFGHDVLEFKGFSSTATSCAMVGGQACHAATTLRSVLAPSRARRPRSGGAFRRCSPLALAVPRRPCRSLRVSIDRVRGLRLAQRPGASPAPSWAFSPCSTSSARLQGRAFGATGGRRRCGRRRSSA
jgi:hypothetical protein